MLRATTSLSTRCLHRQLRVAPLTNPKRWKSETPKKSEPPRAKLIDFNDVASAFQNKSNAELIRSALVFTMCNIPPIVKNSEALLQLSERIIGKKLTLWLVKQTFFRHFCAGETQEEVKPLMDRLKSQGVGGILDYAAEEDVSGDDGPNVEHRTGAREGVVSARTYDYSGEAECDANMRIMLQCIDMAAATSDTPFAAIKITALGKPSFLEKTSQIIKGIRQLWNQRFDRAGKTRVTFEEFQNGLNDLGLKLPDEDVKTLFSGMDKDSDGSIDYIEWTSSLQLEDMATRPFFVRSGYNKSLITRNGALPLLDENETELMDKLMERVNKIAEEAHRKGVRLLIDAEQTYMQPMIDHIALKLQRQYNREKPIIYNTYQCYLTKTKQRVINDVERGRREGFYMAGKLVRGAYMVQERQRAKDRGENSPILSTKQETDDNYNECVKYLLQEIDHTALMLATHNQESIELATELMHKMKIEPAYGIYFGQLLGMSDNLTFPLGMNGYKVFKYVPYGPIEEVLPYLVRRAQENGSVLSSSTKELKMVTFELFRRMSKAAKGNKPAQIQKE